MMLPCLKIVFSRSGLLRADENITEIMKKDVIMMPLF